jgi:hypothetical protein
VVTFARAAVVVLPVFMLVSSFDASAHADDAPEVWNAPPAHVGPQLALRTGYSAPLGAIGNGTSLANNFGGQVPFVLEVGVKIQSHIFIGGSFGFAVGGCNNGPSCTAISAHLGPEIIVDMLPSAKVDPWIGYGIGFEYAQASNPGSSYRGWELGHFMAGVDFRFSRAFAMGPFVDLALAEYTHASSSVFELGTGGYETQEMALNDKAFHEWLTIGVRFVFSP